MALQTTDEMIVKAEIKAALFKKAFEELAIELRQRDPKAFEAAGARLRPMLEAFSVTGFDPPANTNASSQDIRQMRSDGLQEALEAFRRSVGRIMRGRSK